MAFRASCRKASEVLAPHTCLDKAAQPSSRLCRQYSSCTAGTQVPSSSSSSLSPSPSSSSSDSPRLHRRRLARDSQGHQHTRSKTSLIQRPGPPSAQSRQPPSHFLEARFSSSLASSTHASPSGSAITPQRTTQEVRAWFEQHYGEFKLPDAILLQFITHESWDNGTGLTGHNRRLSFLGRRAMNMFMSLFLHLNVVSASPGAGASESVRESVSRLLSASDELDAVLQTSRLGDRVGRSLHLEEVMRWQPAVSDGQVGPKETGLFKIRGVTVEAFVGALYHQHGAAVARAFFDSRILPHLESLPADVQKDLGPAVEAAAAAGRSVLAALPQRAEQQEQRQTTIPVETSSGATFEGASTHQGARIVSSRVGGMGSPLGEADGSSSQRGEHSAGV